MRALRTLALACSTALALAAALRARPGRQAGAAARRLRPRRLGRHRRAPDRRPHEGRAEAAGGGREPARRRRPARRRGGEERARRRQRADADADRRHRCSRRWCSRSCRTTRWPTSRRSRRSPTSSSRCRSTPAIRRRTCSELVAWYKANPTKANYGSPAPGSLPHFFGVMIAQGRGRRAGPRPVQRRRADDERAHGRPAHGRDRHDWSSRSSCTAPAGSASSRPRARRAARSCPRCRPSPKAAEGRRRDRLVRGLRAGEDARRDRAPAQRGDQQGARQRPSCASASPSSASSRPAARRPTSRRAWRRTRRAGRRSSRRRGFAPTSVDRAVSPGAASQTHFFSAPLGELDHVRRAAEAFLSLQRIDAHRAGPRLRRAVERDHERAVARRLGRVARVTSMQSFAPLELGRWTPTTKHWLAA